MQTQALGGRVQTPRPRRVPNAPHVSAPVLAASVAVFRGGRLLLASRTQPPLENLFTLPGGKVEPGETLEEAALRELMEEVAVRARIIGFNDHVELIERDAGGNVTRHFVIASFVARWVSGEAALDLPVIRFFVVQSRLRWRDCEPN